MVEKYYLYSLPEKIITDFEKQRRIKQVFHTLRRHEMVGIHVKSSDFRHIPIHDTPIPEEYNIYSLARLHTVFRIMCTGPVRNYHRQFLCRTHT